MYFFTSAQDLLSQWMAEKINIEDDNDNAIFYDEDDQVSLPSKSRKTDLKDQWDTMLEENAPGLVDPYNKVSSEGNVTYFINKLVLMEYF